MKKVKRNTMKSIFHLHRPMFPPDFERLKTQAAVEFRFHQHNLSLSGTELRVEMPKGNLIEPWNELSYYIKGFLLALNY